MGTLWHFPFFFPIVALLVGSAVGSFLNVCIYRIPAQESIVRPRSHCACGQPIAWFDNIPVFSWFLLGGKARCCGRPFSFRYPTVELLTALLFAAAWMLFPPGKAICGMIFASLLICATLIDLDHMIIPDRFTIGGFVAGCLLAVLVPGLHGYCDGLFVLESFRSLITAIQGAFIGSALVLWIGLLSEVVLRKETMGFGDVKFLGAIGAFCGWEGAVFAVFGGALLGTVGLLLILPFGMASKKEVPSAGAEQDPADGSGEGAQDAPKFIGRHVPFGPMLALAGLLYFFFLHSFIDRYFADVGAVFFGP